MKKIKVLLVYPNLQMVNLLPSNIALLSAYLKEKGIGVRLFDTTFYHTEEKSSDEIRVENLQLRPFNLKEKGIDYKNTDVFEDFESLVDDYKPNVIGVSVTENTYDLGIALISRIRQRKRQIHIIFGGVHPTLVPEDIITNENVDSVCVGEGEEALFELCSKLENNGDISSIKNLWVKKDGKIFKNNCRRLIDINKTPYHDFSIFEEKRFFRPMQGRIYRMIPLLLDRGCPYNCSYCAAPELRQLYLNTTGDAYFRMRSISSIIDELKFQINKFKIDYIYFNSETFLVRKENYLEEFAELYAKHIGLPFWCQTRIETINERKIKILEDMNCNQISIGLEHGNEEFRKKILRKNFTNKQVTEAFKILEKSRIPVTVNNIIGFPDETRDLVFDTIELNRQIKADTINAFIFAPYKGTSLRQYCVKKGYINTEASGANHMKSSILNMPQLTVNEINGLMRTFPLYVRMPRSFFGKIRIAEGSDEEGNQMFKELKNIFYEKFFRKS